MFVIKILNKAKEELNNFGNTLESYNKNQIKIMYMVRSVLFYQFRNFICIFNFIDNL